MTPSVTFWVLFTLMSRVANECASPAVTAALVAKCTDRVKVLAAGAILREREYRVAEQAQKETKQAKEVDNESCDAQRKLEFNFKGAAVMETRGDETVRLCRAAPRQPAFLLAICPQMNLRAQYAVTQRYGSSKTEQDDFFTLRRVYCDPQ
jgi:hypothetical protein